MNLVHIIKISNRFFYRKSFLEYVVLNFIKEIPLYKMVGPAVVILYIRKEFPSNLDLGSFSF